MYNIKKKNEKRKTKKTILHSVGMKFGPAVRFREPIVSGSESVAGWLCRTTDKSRADDDDDGAAGDEKKIQLLRRDDDE